MGSKVGEYTEILSLYARGVLIEFANVLYVSPALFIIQSNMLIKGNNLREF